MKQDLVIGLDCSTTACKAVVFDKDGSIKDCARAPLTMDQPKPTYHEQDATSWWLATCETLKMISNRTDPSRFAGLAISAQRETFVPVDANGDPISPAILWMDERCRLLLPEIEKNLGATDFHRITGKPLSGNLAIGKILWMKLFYPQIFQRTAKFMDVHAFLTAKFTGKPVTAFGCADPTGLFDIERQNWSPEIIDFLGLDIDQLPITIPAGTVIGGISDEAADLTGLPAGLPLIAGIGDGQAGGLGVNLTDDQSAYLNLGTAVITGTSTNKYCYDRSFRTMTGGLPGSYNLETVLLGGTYTISWFINQFLKPLQQTGTSVDESQLEEIIKKIPAGSDGLLLVPYWNSAMNPYWDASASGVTIGWRGIHTLGHFYRAILEGIGYEIRLHIEGVERALTKKINRFIAFGGGTNNNTWNQMIADITGKTIQLSTTPEASALGVAIIVACATGIHPNIHSAVQSMTHLQPQVFSPNDLSSTIYDEYYQDIYRDIYPGLRKSTMLISKLIEDR